MGSRPAPVSSASVCAAVEPGACVPETLDQHQPASRTEKADPALDRLGLVGEHPQHVSAQHRVVRRRLQRRCAGVRHGEGDPVPAGRLVPGPGDHLGREVDAVDGVPGVREQDAQSSGPAAEVGDPRGWGGQVRGQELEPGGPRRGVAQPVVGLVVERRGLGVPHLTHRVEVRGAGPATGSPRHVESGRRR